MAKFKSSFLLMAILTYYNANSQNSTLVTIKVTSEIPHSITERAVKTIILKVQNNSKYCIKLKDVPIMHVDYEVLKKEVNNYIKDSNCIFMPMPMYPGDNYKGIKIEKGKDLDISMNFPPPCNLLKSSGTYKIKYFFTYSVREKFYTIETEWHDYTIIW